MMLFRLFTFIEWVKDCLGTITQLRDTDDYTFNDQLFDHQMNLKITETNQNYDRMLFKGINFFLHYLLSLN